jgi:hypothetical protein
MADLLRAFQSAPRHHRSPAVIRSGQRSVGTRTGTNCHGRACERRCSDTPSSSDQTPPRSEICSQGSGRKGTALPLFFLQSLPAPPDIELIAAPSVPVLSFIAHSRGPSPSSKSTLVLQASRCSCTRWRRPVQCRFVLSRPSPPTQCFRGISAEG